MRSEPIIEQQLVHRQVEFTRAGHRARWLTNGSAAYDEMERQIDAANGSVRLECYMVRPQGPAVRLRESLLRAARRGVKVKVLTDAYGSDDLPSDFFDELRRHGGKALTFNPSRLLRLSFRNHRKLLVCDQRTAVVGGFNIGPEYEGDGVLRGWRDLGLTITGPIAARLASSFDEMFALAPFTPTAIRLYRLRISQAAASEDAITLLTSGPGCPRASLRRALHRDLDAARNVMVMAAYFLPSNRIRRLLRRCAQRGGRVQLMLAGKSDVAAAKLAGEHLYSRLLKAGVDIYEYQPQILHAKLLIVDDIVYVGSCNLDKRSLHINYELLLRLDWPELAAEGRRLFLNDLNYCARVVPAHWQMRRKWWQRLRARAAYWLLAHIDPLIARGKFKPLG